MKEQLCRPSGSLVLRQYSQDFVQGYDLVRPRRLEFCFPGLQGGREATCRAKIENKKALARHHFYADLFRSDAKNQ